MGDWKRIRDGSLSSAQPQPPPLPSAHSGPISLHTLQKFKLFKFKIKNIFS